MKIKRVILKEFKRFTDLEITDIPESAKLIILVGPNGSGKTSVFEALNHWYKLKTFCSASKQDYIEKKGVAISADNWLENKVNIEFHSNFKISSQNIKGKFYFRSAYRNEPDFTINSLNRQDDPTVNVKLKDLMLNDQTVSENYQRLVSQTLAGVYESSNNNKTVEKLRDELIGKIKESLSSIFDDLNLSSIGDPLSNGSFFFEKGVSKDFHYKNLSAGEKSVFDLVLDIIIKSTFYSDAIFCIDEPEAHMHTRLQASVLQELFKLTPDNSQLWVSTHSIGMLKQAEDIEQETPGSVVFLDFGNRDFDLIETIKPAQIDKTIWDRFFDLAFADFSKLIAPRRIVLCEGTSQGRKYKDFDAQIFSKIFGDKHHDTKFVSIGSSSELEKIENQSVNVVSNLLINSEIIKFIDRDDKSDNQVEELKTRGIRVSSRRHIESYLFDDEIIKKLCKNEGKKELFNECQQAKNIAISNSVERDNPEDDIKSASGEIFTKIKSVLSLTQRGDNTCTFIRDTLTPLVTPETNVYSLLEDEIFN